MNELWGKYLASKTKSQALSLAQACFPQQWNFIEDPARLKALFCTRRAAKSYTIGLYLTKVAQDYPNSNCLFLGLTRESAKGIIWKDILKDINLKYNIGMEFNGTALTATLPNGSVIWVTGADADEDEMNKLLGKKYRLVGIDEASMYSINMRQLVYGVLKPATADQRGTICLLGTASNVTRGLFYDVTQKVEPGWSLHTWTAFDNPHVSEQWGEEIEDIKRDRPAFIETPLYKQWYLNQWVIDEDAKVYKYDERRNRSNNLPDIGVPWNYILGVDLGHSPDPSAFVVGAYNIAHPKLYIIHAEKHLKFDITNVAEKIRELELRWTFDVKVVDNANKQAVEELNNRHKTNLIPAEKAGKADFINLMNAEFIQGNILLTKDAELLADEYETLVWETEGGEIKLTPSGQRKEHPGLPNHLTDAGLYLWRHAHQYLFKEAEPKKDMNSQEVWENAHIKRLEQEVQNSQNPNQWETTFTPDEDLFDFEKDDAI